MDPASNGQGSLTRTFATACGELTYRELSDAVAPRLLALLEDVASGRFAGRPFGTDLVKLFHKSIIGGLLPRIAGQFRRELVQVGNHIPPEPHLVPLRMADYCANVDERLRHAENLDLVVELLAFAEGEFLSIHPFADFNGRTVRAVLAELMRRLNLPFVEVAVQRDGPRLKSYLDALADYDNGRIGALVAFWEGRLGQA
jgi:CRISPR-associated endonuclease/helicase Cas3